MSSRRYHPDQKNEIYNLGVVPDLQISKKVDLFLHLFFENSWGSKFNANWVGRGRGRLRPVQNDRTDCRNVLGWFLATSSLKKIMKIHDFPCFSVDFPGFSRITSVSDNQGFG